MKARLTDARGNLQRPVLVHPHREHGVQHASAIHRESRNEVEHKEHDVGRSEARNEADVGIFNAAHAARNAVRFSRDCEPEQQNGGDDDIDRRASDGDEQLFARLIRHALQRCDAANGQ